MRKQKRGLSGTQLQLTIFSKTIGLIVPFRFGLDKFGFQKANQTKLTGQRRKPRSYKPVKLKDQTVPKPSG